jgi:hypothetical protein
MAFHARLTEHDDRLGLQGTISTEKQALDARELREQDRAATLKDTLAQIEALKRPTQTPAQILSSLPKFLALPQPITLTSPRSSVPATQQGAAQAEDSRLNPSRYLTLIQTIDYQPSSRDPAPPSSESSASIAWLTRKRSYHQELTATASTHCQALHSCIAQRFTPPPIRASIVSEAAAPSKHSLPPAIQATPASPPPNLI